MKKIIRQLLEAEKAGQRAAAELEASGEELLRKAKIEGDNAVQKVRSDTERQIEELKRQLRTQAQQGCQAIMQETDATFERLCGEAIRRRPQAVARVVTMLLGEPLVTDAGSMGAEGPGN